MTMQYDVKASKPLTSTGSFVDQTDTNIGRTRIKGVYLVAGAGLGSVAIADGSGGQLLITLNTPVNTNAGALYIPLPGEGILFQTGPYGTVVNTASTVLIYG